MAVSLNGVHARLSVQFDVLQHIMPVLQRAHSNYSVAIEKKFG